MQGGGGKRTFGEYLDTLGLAEKPKPITRAQKKKLAMQGVRTAQRILRMKTRRKGK